MSIYEIERKFLMLPLRAESLLDKLGIKYKEEFIEQYYIGGDDTPYGRMRRKGNRYISTVKSGEGIVREEREKEISQKEYEKYFQEMVGRVISKRRYSFEWDSLIYELDIFEGSLEGLVYLEIEFESEDKARAYQLSKPFDALLYRDVSEEKSMSNYALSRAKYIDIPADKEGLDCFTAGAKVLVKAIVQCSKKIEMSAKSLQEDSSNREDLHALRVNMRKLRVILSIFDTLFKKKSKKHWSRLLKELMCATNAKRDNDVAIVTFTKLRLEVAEDLYIPISLLLDSFEKKDKPLTKQIAKLILSTKFRDCIKYFTSISYDDSLFSKRAKEPILFALFTRFKSHLDTIAKRFQMIERQRSDILYHQIRIDFKKLRYSLEVFEFMANREKYIEVFKKLKTIQQILGEIHDIDVQMYQVTDLHLSHKKEKKFTKLLEKMEYDRERFKEEFVQQYNQFDQKEISQLFLANGDYIDKDYL